MGFVCGENLSHKSHFSRGGPPCESHWIESRAGVFDGWENRWFRFFFVLFVEMFSVGSEAGFRTVNTDIDQERHPQCKKITKNFSDHVFRFS